MKYVNAFYRSYSNSFKTLILNIAKIVTVYGFMVNLCPHWTGFSLVKLLAGSTIKRTLLPSCVIEWKAHWTATQRLYEGGTKLTNKILLVNIWWLTWRHPMMWQWRLNTFPCFESPSDTNFWAHLESAFKNIKRFTRQEDLALLSSEMQSLRWDKTTTTTLQVCHYPRRSFWICLIRSTSIRRNIAQLGGFHFREVKSSLFCLTWLFLEVFLAKRTSVSLLTCL